MRFAIALRQDAHLHERKMSLRDRAPHYGNTFVGESKRMREIREFIFGRKKVNLFLVAVNIFIFAVFTVIGNTEDVYFMLAHGAEYTPAVVNGEYYRLFTSMFLHFGIYHIAYNMLCLIYMGDLLETLIGPVRYLIIYLLGGLAGNLLSMALELRSGHYAVSAGASGAIFAVLGALLYIALRGRGRIGNLDGRRLLIMIVLSVAQGCMETGTDNAAHIGGLIGGFILAACMVRAARGVKFRETK